MDTKKESKKEKETQKKHETISIHEMTQTRLQETEKKLSEMHHKYKLALADSENMRKRLQKEKHVFMRFAKEDLIRDILLPLDQFELALKHAQDMSDEVKNWALGFEMILGQFNDILEMNKVTTFSSKGKLFDSKKHEAIETVETDQYRDNEIIEECSKGYMIQDQLLRAARVKVAKHPKAAPKEEETQVLDEKIEEKKNGK
ncbi:MAG: Protein GrpE [Chlamydiae bacterium]|nr:Protein GrpE [Chlamydiota bacterium]